MFAPPASRAQRADWRRLLEAEGLILVDFDGVADEDVLLAIEDERVLGGVAVQRFASDGLLRSLVVASEARGTGLGARLVEAVIRSSRQSGLERLWLLTTTAADFFVHGGWKPAARASAPSGIAATAEFASACPAEASCLVYEL